MVDVNENPVNLELIEGERYSKHICPALFCNQCKNLITIRYENQENILIYSSSLNLKEIFKYVDDIKRKEVINKIQEKEDLTYSQMLDILDILERS